MRYTKTLLCLISVLFGTLAYQCVHIKCPPDLTLCGPPFVCCLSDQICQDGFCLFQSPSPSLFLIYGLSVSYSLYYNLSVSESESLGNISTFYDSIFLCFFAKSISNRDTLIEFPFKS